MAVIGMLAVCLLEPVNSTLRVDNEHAALWWDPPGYDASHRLLMPLNEWFGRREDFLAHQNRYGRSTVTMTPGDEWAVHIDEPAAIRITSFTDDASMAEHPNE